MVKEKDIRETVMSGTAQEARKLLSQDTAEDKARFATSINPATSTNELLAMLEQAKQKDKEREEAIRSRRAEMSKEAYAKRRAEEAAMIEEPEAPKWVGPAPWELAAMQRNAAPVTTAPHAERVSPLQEQQTAPQPVYQSQMKSGVNSTMGQNAVLPTPLPAAPATASSSMPDFGKTSFQDESAVSAASAAARATAAEASAIAAASAELANVKRSYEMKLESLQELLTTMQSRNEQLQSDKEELSVQLSDARAKVDDLDRRLVEKLNPKDLLARGQLITKEELAEVRGEVAMQERIVKVLEKENEILLSEKKTLTNRLKAIEKGAHELEARQNFNGKGQQQQLGGLNTSATTGPPSLNTSAAGGVFATGPTIAELNLQLQRSKTTEAELRVEVDTLRKQKKDLEMKFATVDLQQVEEAKLDARNAKANLKRKDLEYTNNVTDMARKIAWYVEHQEFNNAQADLLKEREATIHQLRLKLHEMESLVTKSGVVRTDKDRQIKNLQRRALELEEALRVKNPNSIAELIRSVQPSFEQSARYKELEGTIADLNAQLLAKDKECEGMVDRLRVESDRLRAAYQLRIEKLEDEMKMRVLNAQSRKVKELEKQLTDARKYYTEKVKELEHSVVLLRRGIAPSSSSAPGGESSTNHSSTQDDQKPQPKRAGPAKRNGQQAQQQAGQTKKEASPASTASQQQHGGQQEDEEHVTEAAVAAFSSTQIAAGPSFSSQAPALISLQRENIELKKQLEAMMQQVATLASTPNIASASFGLASSLQTQLNHLSAELALHKRLLLESQEMTRQSNQQWEDRLLQHRRDHAKELQLIRTEHDGEVIRLQSRHDQELKALIDKQEQILSQHRQDLVSGSQKVTAISSKGVQGYLEAVGVKLQLLEHRQLSREAETEREIAEIRRVAQFETALEKQKLVLAVEEKNQEIHRFKTQLDQLLSDLAQLRHP